jgi:hypothetical protein
MAAMTRDRPILATRHEHAHPTARRTHTVRGGFGHARQHLVQRECGRDPVGEIGEHFVWARALAIHEAIG